VISWLLKISEIFVAPSTISRNGVPELRTDVFDLVFRILGHVVEEGTRDGDVVERNLPGYDLRNFVGMSK